MIETELSCWRPGDARDTIVAFLSAADGVPEEQRVAVFDNDGTLWCERPAYVQQAFISWALEERTREDPDYEVPPAAEVVLREGVAAGDATIDELAVAVNDVFEGLAPEEFTECVRAFAASYVNPALQRTPLELRYSPMLEVLNALRRRDFDVFIVTGGGAAFVQSISQQAYGVPTERVVGTLVDYAYDTDSASLRRRSSMPGAPNEGVEKVCRVQQMIGRRPIFAAGNSAGDAEMLDYALSGDVPGLALLVDHDDGEREIAYHSVAATFDDVGSLSAAAGRPPWTVVSMQDDWARVFPHDEPS